MHFSEGGGHAYDDVYAAPKGYVKIDLSCPLRYRRPVGSYS